MDKTIVTFGEIMLRLKSPGHERLLQSPVLEAAFGGGEANVAVAVSQSGMNARFVTVLPDNEIGDACVGELRRFGVDTSFVKRGAGRMGVYYLETGSNQRPSNVVYDRGGSAFAHVSPGDVDWTAAFAGADWFHITGITPAISQNAADTTLEAVKIAKACGLTVSCDLNYRGKLWKYGKAAPQIMTEIFSYADIGVANEFDCQQSLGITAGGTSGPDELSTDAYRALCAETLRAFPNLRMLAITLRESVNADTNRWRAVLAGKDSFHTSKTYVMTDIVDRVGGGDAFAAGLIYGLITYGGEGAKQQALDFAVAAGCLKHTIPGDFNRVSPEEIKRLMQGDASGRVRR